MIMKNTETTVQWVTTSHNFPSNNELSKAHCVMRNHIVDAIRRTASICDYDVFFVGGLPRKEVYSKHMLEKTGVTQMLRSGIRVNEISKIQLPADTFVPQNTDIDLYIPNVGSGDPKEHVTAFMKNVALSSGYLCGLAEPNTYSFASWKFHTTRHPMAIKMEMIVDVTMSAGMPDADVNQITVNARSGKMELGKGPHEKFPVQWWQAEQYMHADKSRATFFCGGIDFRGHALEKVIEKIKRKKATIFVLHFATWEENMKVLGLETSFKKYLDHTKKLINYRLKKLTDDGFEVDGLALTLQGHGFLCTDCAHYNPLDIIKVLCDSVYQVPYIECTECHLQHDLL